MTGIRCQQVGILPILHYIIGNCIFSVVLTVESARRLRAIQAGNSEMMKRANETRQIIWAVMVQICTPILLLGPNMLIVFTAPYIGALPASFNIVYVITPFLYYAVPMCDGLAIVMLIRAYRDALVAFVTNGFGTRSSSVVSLAGSSNSAK